MIWRGGIQQRSKIYNSELKKKSTFEPGPFKHKTVKPLDYNDRVFHSASAFSEAKHALKKEHVRSEADPIDLLIGFTIKRLQNSLSPIDRFQQSPDTPGGLEAFDQHLQTVDDSPVTTRLSHESPDRFKPSLAHINESISNSKTELSPK